MAGQKTAIGAFLEAGDDDFCQNGTKGVRINEVAVSYIGKYIANSTPPTTAYNGGAAVPALLTSRESLNSRLAGSLIDTGMKGTWSAAQVGARLRSA